MFFFIFKISHGKYSISKSKRIFLLGFLFSYTYTQQTHTLHFLKQNTYCLSSLFRNQWWVEHNLYCPMDEHLCPSTVNTHWNSERGRTDLAWSWQNLHILIEILSRPTPHFWHPWCTVVKPLSLDSEMHWIEDIGNERKKRLMRLVKWLC